MEREEIYKDIKNELITLYGNVSSESRLNWLTDALCDVIIDETIGLDDVVFCMIEFEETLPYEYHSEFNSVLSIVLERMPVDKVNADKLYTFFIDNVQDLNVFIKLMGEYREYLSDTQYQRLKEEGRCFDEVVLKNCIDDWEDD